MSSMLNQPSAAPLVPFSKRNLWQCRVDPSLARRNHRDVTGKPAGLRQGITCDILPRFLYSFGNCNPHVTAFLSLHEPIGHDLSVLLSSTNSAETSERFP